MTSMRAALRAVVRLMCPLMIAAPLGVAPAMAEWNAPWKDPERALVIDAYEFNPIEWNEMTTDERIAGFINKASDGLAPEWNCSKESGEAWKLCTNRWWKYSVTKELYQTRRQMAKMKGLLWGAYHLGRPGNPREQADHFLDFAEPTADELIAIDIEDNDSDEWMSLEEAEIFADQIKIRTGRYPVLYTNGNTAQYVADNAEDYPLLSRLPLWYARYRDDITGHFPEENWPSYALWQFSSMHNCNERSCPYRVKGAKTDIDVNVAPMNVAELREAWPFNELIKPRRAEPSELLIASVEEDTRHEVAKAAEVPVKADTARERPLKVAEVKRQAEEPADHAVDGTIAVGYAPSDHKSARDPLRLMNEIDRDPIRADQKAELSAEEIERFGSHVKAFKSHISLAAEGIDRFLFADRRDREARAPSVSPSEIRSIVLAMLEESDSDVQAKGRQAPHDADRGARVVEVEMADLVPENLTLDQRIGSAFAISR